MKLSSSLLFLCHKVYSYFMDVKVLILLFCVAAASKSFFGPFCLS